MLQKFTTLYTNSDWKSENIDMIIDSSLGEMELKNMLQKSKIVSLSSFKFEEEIGTFANVLFFIKRDEKEIIIWLNSDDIESSCLKFVSVGLNVQKIETIPSTLDEKTSSKIISSIKEKINKQKEQEIEKKMKEKEKESKSVEWKEKDNAVMMLNQTIEDIDILKNKVNTIASGNELKKLTEYQEELKKLIRGSNIEKMKQQMEDVFLLMQKLENDYIDAIRPYQENINKNSVVTNIDVINEYNIFVRSTKAQKANTQQNRDWIYYNTLWIYWIYIRFLQRDFLNKFSNIQNIFFGIWNTIEWTTISLAIFCWFFIIFSSFFWYQIDLIIYKSLIYIWCVWFSISITSFLRKNNIIMIFVWILSSLIVYYFILNLIISFFSI